MKKLLVTIFLSALIGLFSACAGTDNVAVQTHDHSEHMHDADQSASAHASAALMPTQGNNVQGNVTFRQEADGVRVIAEIRGLTPGSHGFHVHENGDCSAPDASSAGGHFNPHQTEHGKVGEGAYHAGDLPSLEADADGNAKLDVLLNSLEITGDHGIAGRGLIVHADPDDYVSQPTGNAGARVACAVIQ